MTMRVGDDDDDDDDDDDGDGGDDDDDDGDGGDEGRRPQQIIQGTEKRSQSRKNWLPRLLLGTTFS